jgi:hypothetical protein
MSFLRSDALGSRIPIPQGGERLTDTDPTSKEPDSLKETLIQRYRSGFVDKLTPDDLTELQEYLEKEFDDQGHINIKYRDLFEEKLRNYFHESVLEREIVTIEALVRKLSPEDLKKNREIRR